MLYTSLPISSHRTTTVSDYGVIFLLKCRARKTDVKKWDFGENLLKSSSMCEHCVKNIKEENTILIEKESHSRTLSGN